MDNQLLARIDENVKYLVKARLEDKAEFEKHVLEDKKIAQEFIRPLWEKSQQDIGAANARTVGGKFVSYIINAGIACVAAIAAVKGIPR